MISLMTSRPGPDSPDLLERALRAIEDRQLPRGVVSRVWGGRGSGLPCSLCGQPIERSDVEIELDEGQGQGGARVRFHSSCHLQWQEACKRVSEGHDH